MTTEPSTTPKPRRRWLQFSLRTMMVLMLICSIPCGWLAYKLKLARDHREAVKAIEKLGGSVAYDPFFEITRGDRMVTWAGKMIGEDLHTGEVEVDLTNTPVTDAELLLLYGLGLPQVKWLHLSDTHVSDVGLVHLRGLTALYGLSLRNTHVTDAGVAELQKALPKLMIDR